MMVEQASGEAALFEPAQLLADLLAASKANEPNARPNRLPHKAITKMPALFQPRGMSEKHIGDLVRVIQNHGEVDPLTVIAVGSRAVLVDGHHRLEAYERAKKLAGIPVTYFDGTPEEAVLEAGRANSKAKLPMSGQERQNYAWRLVLLGQHSKAKIVQAAGVSAGQVGNMRVVLRKLGEEAFGFTSWWRARRHAQGEVEEHSDEDRDQWMQDMADDFADRLVKTFAMSLAEQPEIAAMALASYFGRRLPDVVQELRSFVPDDEAEDQDDF
nr:ParB/RepB/Spo0J family partition protein [Mesorhizobium sp. L2C054A000]